VPISIRRLCLDLAAMVRKRRPETDDVCSPKGALSKWKRAASPRGRLNLSAPQIAELRDLREAARSPLRVSRAFPSETGHFLNDATSLGRLAARDSATRAETRVWWAENLFAHAPAADLPGCYRPLLEAQRARVRSRADPTIKNDSPMPRVGRAGDGVRGADVEVVRRGILSDNAAKRR